MLRACRVTLIASFGATVLVAQAAHAGDAGDAADAADADVDGVEVEDAAADAVDGLDGADDAGDAGEDATTDAPADTFHLVKDTGLYAFDADLGDACWLCFSDENGAGGCGGSPERKEPDGSGCRCDVRSTRSGDVFAGAVAIAVLAIALRRRRDGDS